MMRSISRPFRYLSLARSVRTAILIQLRIHPSARSQRPDARFYRFSEECWCLVIGVMTSATGFLRYSARTLRLEDVVTRVEKGRLHWFRHLEMVNESRLTKLYRANVCDEKVDKDRSKIPYADQIGDILKRAMFSAPETDSLHEKIDACQ
ncbi:hypothetical protein EVAR_10104_1 [Eumeta japonica]|uniref:Uncharacterized protein n=1 Tax=Eumeta variegata TaxID=151549 RepID=A0A4C1UBZ4_EUMVA|nr:hypothetical protein EVAR_10104_1 [Eumeta japonica]